MNACQEAIVIDLGKMKVVKNQGVVLTCVGLGSCIALCVYDPVAKVGGMAHMVLPESSGRQDEEPSPRYVDAGVPMLFEEMTRQGAIKSRLVVKIVGGASMLSVPGLNGRLNIGERNIAAARAALAKRAIAVSAADLGGRFGRTVQLFAASGCVTVRTVGKESVDL